MYLRKFDARRLEHHAKPPPLPRSFTVSLILKTKKFLCDICLVYKYEI